MKQSQAKLSFLLRLDLPESACRKRKSFFREREKSLIKSKENLINNAMSKTREIITKFTIKRKTHCSTNGNPPEIR